MKHAITVLGDGAWGTAIATLLAHNGHEVNIWCHDPRVALHINVLRHNMHYLPRIDLPYNISALVSLESVTDSSWIFVAVPVKFLRNVLEQVKPYTNSQQRWVILSKGIEAESCLLPTQLVDQVLGPLSDKAVISGPSFARDLAEKKITGVTLAATSPTLAQDVTSLMTTSYFTLEVQDDLIGVQTGGALKNVVALAVGMLDAQGYTDNTKAFVITHALQEMSLVTQALGGKPETLYSLAGVGDLLLTCMGSLSKNLALGKQLGSGKTLQELLQQHPQMPEGINTVVSVHQLITQHSLKLPLLQGVYACIFQQKTVQELLSDILS